MTSEAMPNEGSKNPAHQALSWCEERLRAALAYAEIGWPVLPLHWIDHEGHCSCKSPACSSPGKHPRTRHGVKDATTDSKSIRSWWLKWPRANIGVMTGAVSSIVVLDVDPRHGGNESLVQLVREHGAPPQTVVSLTGGGGEHLFYRHPGADVVIRNATGLQGLPGLDVRGDGGYVVVPPSGHSSGHPYTWEPGGHPWKTEPAAMPDWLRQLLVGQTERAPTQEPATPSTEACPGSAPQPGDGKIPEGRRNATLASLGGTMRRRGMSETSIRAALRAENAANCVPPLPDAEVEAVVHSVARYEPGRDGDGPEFSVIAWPDPLAPEALHGLAGDVVQAIEPHSEADPVALLVQFLAAAGNVIGRGPHFRAEADVHSLNLFVALVGATSKGRKGSAWSHVKRVFEVAAPEWARERGACQQE